MKIFKKLFAIGVMISCTVISGCTDPDNARRILLQNGYTDIKITGYNIYSCSEDDSVHTGFSAKSPNGTIVEGTVCGGLLFKNSTIRFE